MKRLQWRFSVYRMLIGIGTRESMAYRANYLLNIVGLLLQVFMLSMVWQAVYQGHETMNGVDLPTMVAYVTLISVQTWLVNSSTGSLVPQRIRQGQVAFDICRPLGLLGQLFPRQVGVLVGMLPFAIVALPFASLIGTMRAPAGSTAAIAYAVSLLFAFVIATLTSTIIGMVAFWTIEVRAVSFIYRTIATFFAGALVPLWFMPGWLRTLADVLPFQAVAFTPVSIYLGRFQDAELLKALGIQIFWIAAMAALSYVVWRRALYKVVIQGG